MLYGQIPQDYLKQIAVELSISLPGVGAKITQRSPLDTRYSKLGVVIKYLEQYEEIGTIDSPCSYFKGELPMRWGPYGFKDEQPIVFFAGATRHTALGLGGSPHHVIGNSPGPLMHSRSGTPELLKVLQDEFSIPQHLFDRYPGLDDMVQDLNSYALDAVLWTAMEYKGSPPQRVEFIAKKLLFGKPARELFSRIVSPYKDQVLLGTPLYVAMIE